jgi:hypothetical protein
MFERQQQSQRHHLADHLAARQEKQPRPATGSSVGPSEADLKRREHLKEAKRRNEETRRQFSSRVKQYFAAGIEAERQKAEALLASPSNKMKKKDADKMALESGHFLQSMAQAGLDISSVTTAALSAAAGQNDENGISGRSKSRTFGGSSIGRNGSSSSGGIRSPSISMPAQYSGSSNLEERLLALEKVSAENSAQLQTIIALQKEMLEILKANHNVNRKTIDRRLPSRC